MDYTEMLAGLEKLREGPYQSPAYSLTDPGIYAQYILVTPEIARFILEHCNEMNRKMRRGRTAYYTDAMEHEEWSSLNGDTITIDREGQLVDGQHRLASIDATGTTHECLVVFGVVPEVRSTKDDGGRRMFRDDLTMNGIENAPLKDKLTRLIAQWDANGGLAYLSFRANRRRLAKVFAQNKGGIESALEETRRFSYRWPGNKNSLTFAWWLIVERVKSDPDLARKFFSVITIGSQAPEDIMLVRLRERFERMAYVINGQLRHEPSGNEVYWIIRAWNYWVTGETAQRYVTPGGGISDPYPLPRQATRAQRIEESQ